MKSNPAGNGAVIEYRPVPPCIPLGNGIYGFEKPRKRKHEGKYVTAYQHVYTHPLSDRFWTAFSHKGVRHTAGSFDTAEEAHQAVEVLKDRIGYVSRKGRVA